MIPSSSLAKPYLGGKKKKERQDLASTVFTSYCSQSLLQCPLAFAACSSNTKLRLINLAQRGNAKELD